MSENKITAVDGRRLRSERTRLAIIDAAIALQEEGVLIPTAQQISDRAGVLIRNIKIGRVLLQKQKKVKFVLLKLFLQKELQEQFKGSSLNYL